MRITLLACAAAAAAKSCLTLCDPRDGSPPDSPVPGILQARTLEWVAISFSRESSQPRDGTQVSHNMGRFFTKSDPPGKPVNNSYLSSVQLLSHVCLFAIP